MSLPAEGRTVDVVGVFDEKFNQLFPEGRPIKATILESSKMMEHPTESGKSITDDRVILPAEIELTLVLSGEEFRDTYAQIKTKFLSLELFIVQTLVGSFPNMAIDRMPHDEDTGTVEAVVMAVRFKEIQLVTAQFQALPPAAVASKAPGAKGKRNASTVKRGEQTGKTEGSDGTGNKSSVLYDIFYGGGDG